jgi:uncharacterized protein (DUF433 family)
MKSKKQSPKRKTEDRITINPAVLGGKPIIRGLRISVEQVLRALAKGVSMEEILEDYPVLEEEDIRACLVYAADLVEEEKVFAVSGHEDSR